MCADGALPSPAEIVMLPSSSSKAVSFQVDLNEENPDHSAATILPCRRGRWLPASTYGGALASGFDRLFLNIHYLTAAVFKRPSTTEKVKQMLFSVCPTLSQDFLGIFSLQIRVRMMMGIWAPFLS